MKSSKPKARPSARPRVAKRAKPQFKPLRLAFRPTRSVPDAVGAITI